MNETNINKLIMLAISKMGARVFRNNTGVGWVGRLVTKTAQFVTLADPRPLHAGLIKGSSDLIGWTPKKVTPEMVGKTVAVFTAIEVKTEKGRVTPEQVQFIEQVRKAGGIAGVVRSPEEAERLIGTTTQQRNNQ